MAKTPNAPSSDEAAENAETPCINWAATLAQHDRWLRTIVYARLGEKQAVEDVMQEIALAVVAQKAPLTDCNRLGAWLYRIAVRQALLYRRQRGRQRKLMSAYATIQAVREKHASTDDTFRWLLDDERYDMLRAAINRLPRRDAEILLLKYSEGWSYLELAQHLGISQSAIEARLHRARHRLRQSLSEPEP